MNVQFESMFKIVQDVALRHQQSGAYITPDDTVCVICGISQRVYTGVSRVEVRNGQPMNIHAEIIAMEQMLSAGENAVDSLLLISAVNCRPMLPCSGCIQFIISQNPNNANSLVVLPDRNIPLAEIGRSPAAMGSMPFHAAPGNSMYMNSGSVPFGGAAPVGNSVYNGGSVPFGGAPQGYPSGSVPFGGAAPAGSVFGQGTGGMSQPFGNANPAAGGYMGASFPAGSQKAKNSNADYLKSRVGSLMHVADDDEDEEEEKPTAKGLFGKLFKK